MTEEARLNEWLTSKEKEIEEMQRIDASDTDNVHRAIKQLQVQRYVVYVIPLCFVQIINEFEK